MMIYVRVVQTLNFVCNKCSASTLPFYDIGHLSNISINSPSVILSDSSMSEGEVTLISPLDHPGTLEDDQQELLVDVFDGLGSVSCHPILTR